MGRGRVNGILLLLQPSHTAWFAEYLLRLNDDGYDGNDDENDKVTMMRIIRVSNPIFSNKTTVYPNIT